MISADIAALATVPLRSAQDGIRREQRKLRRRLEKLAGELPVRGFVDGIVGFGLFGLAQIVAEAGALDAYDNPAKLWRRMGLAVASGVAERCLAGVNSGYSPRRRTIMFVIGEALIKKQNRYRTLYLERKVLEEQKAPGGSKLLWHRRAHRYMEKRLLRDLWSAWRSQEVAVP